MTFKEKLVEQAERANVSEINIEKEIGIIKAKMAERAEEREFTISLIKSTSNQPIFIGRDRVGCFSTFVPKKCAPHLYRGKFVDALLDLGFEEKDITFEEDTSFSEFHSYDIKITW